MDIGSQRPIGVEVTAFGAEGGIKEPYMPQWWFDSVQEALGFLPQQNIQLDAFANQQVDHCVLGLLAVGLAERYNCLIDVDWVTLPPLSYGHVFEVEWIEDDKYYFSYVLDAAAFKAWMEHPDFRLLK